MSDQSPDPSSDQSPDPSSGPWSGHSSDEGGSAKPSFGDSIRAKVEEYELDRHLAELAGTVEHAVRQGVARAGELAHEHKGDIERLIDKAAGAVDRRTDGKHADTINQVRGSLERGVARIAEQRPDVETGTGPATEEPPTDVPPSTPSDG